MNIQSNKVKMTKSTDKRKAIFEATLKLVSRRGFHGTAMSMVAKKAKVSAGIIYHYFKSKDELIDELYKYLKQKSADTLLAKHDPNLSLIEQLRKSWDDLIRYHVDNPVESAFLDQYSKSPYYSMKVEEQVLKYFKVYTGLIEQGIKEKIIKDFPLMVYIAFSVDIASSIAQKNKLGMLDLNKKLLNEIIESTWKAVKL
jgi:AcrR family transcriptional regulator